ncbi:acyl-ACP thioesterase domain-containing protein [Tissierella sp. Yu-01]|uniref:acyl-[acyl-carrier-protein] thioesterase n=1 Tax=Tissierella sp. Yu-01 TaxID=3035694 RepID=UPI00240D5AA5|nr:acyl-ACP thioesterase domain-containing protein [Tissierella sp. Yu-01]WFA09373.1 thioesterase [Tissierella sp. Yu-01]
MSKYTKEFIIPYYDTNKNGFVRPESLLSYMGETSSLHSDFLGVGIEALVKHNVVWMLNRWRVRFYKYPKALDKVTIGTWSSGINRFYATREFVIYDEDNEKVVEATTQWVFLDTLKKRPIRVPQELSQIYGTVVEKNLHDFYDFKDEFSTTSGIDFHVRKSDIDYNHHVNNVKYLNWMLEAIPSDIDDKYKLYELDIQYKKEIKLGSTINSSLTENREENFTYLHKITDGEELNAYGRTVWK